MKVEAPASTKHSISQLEEAFGVFNQVSADLGNIYQNLETRVAGLKEELAASNSARIRELTEKERLAAKLSSLMDALPGGVIVIDLQGKVKEMNPAALSITGKCFVGQSWQQLFAQIASSEPVYDGEFSLRDGKRVSITSTSFGAEGDRILLVTDITENYRLNSTINREKRLTALGEMAARLAHQVRTPLSSAILYLSNLSTRLSTGMTEDSGKAVKNIQNQLGQIEKLVEGMLSYIKGDIASNRTFSPVALLVEVKLATTMQVDAANGTLRLLYEGDDFEITGDHEALFNALSNLVINAVQAVDSKPDITLRLLQERDGVRFIVTDKGPGIEDTKKEQVFDPFFSTRPGGTGLGLAVVMSAVNAHGGQISIETPAGGGTEFNLTIPRQQADFNEFFTSQEIAGSGA